MKEKEKKQIDEPYCGFEYFGKNGCNGCTKGGICELFYMLLEYGAFEDEAREICKKLEKRNLGAD